MCDRVQRGLGCRRINDCRWGHVPREGFELFGPQASIYVGAEDCGGGGAEAWYGGSSQADAIAVPYGPGIAFTDRDIDLDGPPPLRLTVVVTDLLERPVGGICIAVTGTETETGVTTSDGKASFDLAAAGTYLVSAGN